eukprot:1191722-Prorocentrum_minimum.AAC.3
MIEQHGAIRSQAALVICCLKVQNWIGPENYLPVAVCRNESSKHKSAYVVSIARRTKAVARSLSCSSHLVLCRGRSGMGETLRMLSTTPSPDEIDALNSTASGVYTEVIIPPHSCLFPS